MWIWAVVAMWCHVQAWFKYTRRMQGKKQAHELCWKPAVPFQLIQYLLLNSLVMVPTILQPESNSQTCQWMEPRKIRIPVSRGSAQKSSATGTTRTLRQWEVTQQPRPGSGPWCHNLLSQSQQRKYWYYVNVIDSCVLFVTFVAAARSQKSEWINDSEGQLGVDKGWSVAHDLTICPQSKTTLTIKCKCWLTPNNNPYWLQTLTIKC